MEEWRAIQTAPPGNDASVIATNDDAFESKVAAMDVGYFKDPYLSMMKNAYVTDDRTHAQFLEAPRNAAMMTTTARYRRQPVINRGTLARIAIKESVVRAFMALLGKGMGDASRRVQIVSLGAGFDTFPFKMLEEYKRDMGDVATVAGIDYVELDLAHVVREKQQLCREFLREDSPLFERVQMSEGHVHATARGHTGTYTLMECDLRDVTALQDALTARCDLSCATATIVLAEICLVYMQATQSDAVIRRLSSLFHGTRAFVNMEQVGRGDDFGSQMDRNVAARGCPLYGMRKYPDLVSQKQRFETCGWAASCRAFTMLELFHECLSKRRIAALQRVELLDEMEEFNLLLRHYCVVIAIENSDGDKKCCLGVPELLEMVRTYQ